MIPLLLFLAPITKLKAAKAVEQLTAVSATLSSNYNNEKEFSAANCINWGTSPGRKREICHTKNETLPKALRTQALTALTSKFGLVGFVWWVWFGRFVTLSGKLQRPTFRNIIPALA